MIGYLARWQRAEKVYCFGDNLIEQIANAMRRAANANENRSSSVSALSITLTTVGSCNEMPASFTV